MVTAGSVRGAESTDWPNHDRDFAYGPGGLRFRDDVPLDTPLKPPFAVVTTFGSRFRWG
jgi:hypothetical protein